MQEYPQLLIENQLCFPLYACSKEVVRAYAPFLEPLGVTYTQYLVMMVLWEKESLKVSDLGEELWLESGTLTPVLKKLEAKGYLTRQRSSEDERCVTVTLTKEGEDLKQKAADIPKHMTACMRLQGDEAEQLKALLKKLMKGLEKTEAQII